MSASDYLGVMSEHEKAESSAEKSHHRYEPTPEEEKLIKRVLRIFEANKTARALYDRDWLDHYKMFRGKQWKEQRPSYRHSEVYNLIFQAIQGQVPIMTDIRPKIEFMPTEPSDREFVEILNEVEEADWEKNNWSADLTEILFDGHIYGTGLGEVGYDPKADFGMGAITFRSSDPFYCFPDPSARDVNKEADSFVYAEPLPVRRIKRDYPHVKDFIKADLVDLMNGSKTESSPLKFRSPIDNKVTIEGSSPQDAADKDKALLITCYWRCEEYEEEQKTDETGAVSYEQKLKYPNGRKTVICNGVLCDDGPIPYDDAKFPHIRYSNYLMPREFWGMGEVEQLSGPQRTFNKVVSFVLDTLTLMGNPVWVVDTTSGIDTDNLFNRPGLVIEKEPGSEVRREAGVELQGYVMSLIDRLAEWFNGISGSQDITRGVNPTGVTAASAIADLQQAAQTRMRQKSRNLDCTLQDFGQLYASRVMQFYDVPRIIRLTGKDGAQKYFKFQVEKVPDPATGEVKRMATVHHFDQTGGLDPAAMKQYELRGKLDVRVSTGSTLPFSKKKNEEEVFKLFELGIIDDIEVLKRLDYPNWEAVKERMEQKAMAMAQAEADAAAAEAQAKAGPPPQAVA